ncbi:Integrator complex subunit 7 [Myotis brandtii]|uniref:Integrator complex subunit 7 n=1 Tax=Myotis brandtii TaxID=109478 RepID=S7PGA2_MYOBR|nr:Integrator complex subunit 7 [Myotis brandtii]
MASNSTKSFLADAGYGEQELDANSALMELDKGLRSGKLGEQCEAVVRFPRLFQKYPFPILINSAFLKLADVFRVGNNFLRLCVLKVTQQSEKHLEKILNVDEFVKRIFSVIHSNDPVARAITLRMLGSLASIIPERKNAHHSIRQSLDSHDNVEVEAAVFAAANFSAQSKMLGSLASIIPERKNAHHSIRQSLDSHDNVEVEAAVFAAANFSAQSKDFAVGICNKISEMIQGLATPVDLKLKLIPILQHMHHDAILASSARQLLQQLVTSYPSTKMVIVSLHTFTLLAASSLVDTPKQIQLLLQYLKNDPRKAVKRLAIQDLKLLANKTPHTWSRENIQALCECALQTPYDSLKLGMLSVLSTLSGTIAVKHYFSIASGNVGSSPRSSDLVKLAQECCYHNNRGIAAHGVRVLTNITVSCQEKDLLALEQDAVFGLESLLVLCSQDDSPGAQATLKIALKCMVKLAKGRPHLSQSVVETLLTQLHSAQDAARILMCHCLAAIAMQLPVLGDGMLGDLMELYKVIGRSATDKQQELLMKQSMEEFRSLASRYGDLYQASFDADSATLRNVELQQQSCLLMSHAIEALILDPESASSQEYGSIGAAHADSEYERRMMSVYNHVLEEVESLNRKYTPHTACLCNAIIALLKVPLSFQRYFFQKLQSTSIKLALSPSPRNPAEPIAVQNNQQLALKVEGVVQHGSKPGLFRKIQSVCLNVSSTLQSKSGQEYKIPIDNMTNEMEQRVEPHNDYFSTQFLLNFAILGTHNITVESSVKDANGIVWKTGPRTTIFVKSLEDPYSQQIRLQQQQAQQPLQQQQQRNAYTRF